MHGLPEKENILQLSDSQRIGPEETKSYMIPKEEKLLILVVGWTKSYGDGVIFAFPPLLVRRIHNMDKTL